MKKQNRISNCSQRHLTPLSGLPAKLLVVPMICGAVSSSHASVLAYDGFGDALNNTTLNGYDGTSAESGFSGAWVVAGGTNNTVTPPVFGNQVGIFGGVTPDSTGGAEHVVRKAQFNLGTYTRALTVGTIDLTVDGTYYMSFFAAASGFDFVSQVGLSNATNELMAGQAYNGNRGLTAYYGVNGTNVATNEAAGNNLNLFNWADRNAFFTVQFTKTNSGTTNDVAVTINAYDMGNVSDFDISGGPQKTRTVNLTGVSAVFDKLKVKLDGTVEFDEVRLGQSLLDVTTGGVVPDSDGDGMLDVWEQQIIDANPGDAIATFTDVLPGDDYDTDNLTNLEEYSGSVASPAYTFPPTSPIDNDSDNDTLLDGNEAKGISNTFSPGTPMNPSLADTDGDKVSDLEEINGTLNTAFGNAATDPTFADTDGDGAKDYKELVYRSDPNDFSSLPTPSFIYLINSTLNNGSFSTRDGGTPITAKITQWDAVAPNNIDNWTEWGPAVAGPSTAPNDSGVEGLPANTYGYFQSGNAAYNMTTNVAAAGAVYACGWTQKSATGATLSVQLVYRNASNNIVAIPASLATTNTTGAVGDLVYQIPTGSPAIGFQIGIGVSSQGAWIDSDDFTLNIADSSDDDGDGLTNLWETAHGLNPNSSVGVNGASGNPDGDAFTNLEEQAGGSDPQVAASIPGDIDGDGLGDTWETTYFGGLSNPNGAPGLDPDGDKDTNLVEFTNDTDPNAKFSFYSSLDPVDSVPDSWKSYYGIALNVTGLDDSDGDTLINEDEFTLNTNPVVGDSDIDGLSDGNEVNVSLTNPLDSDSDDDGLSDGAEVNTHLTSPNDADSDDDGYKDGVEVTATSNPNLGSSTPVTITGATVLIDTLHNNGSFEFLGGVTTSNAKASNWDTDPDGDVDSWKDWNAAASGPSTAPNDSGTEVIPNDATAGTRVAFLQGGNAAYNRTSHIIAQGDVFTYTWDWVLAGRGDATAQLAYWDPAANGGAGGAIAIAGTATTNVSNAAQNIDLGTTWTVPALDPAIGKEIVMTIATTGNYPEVDNFVLSVVTGSGNDSDADGMDDTWETTYGLNVGTNDSASDLDNDGTDNLAEFRLGLIPNSGSSRFAATSGPANGQITWPSVTGVTFKIERSGTLSGWTVLQPAYAGTAGTTSYTDPSPLPGKGFYKITLNP